MPGEIQPQEIVEKPVGAVTEPVVAEVQPQPETEPAKLGAEEVGKVPAVPRTYSQAEWERREGEKDRETATLRRSLSQVTLQSQIAEAQKFEREAQAKDQAKVQGGEMTQEAASAASQMRQSQIQLYLTGLQVREDQENIAKEKVAKEIAKKYGVNSDDLLSDQNIRSPADMIEKASTLRHFTSTERVERLEAELKALKEGEPKFDRGQAGGATELSEGKRLKSIYPTMFPKK